MRDALGKEFIDAVSGGVWTVNVGYGRQRIADAVRHQLVEMNYFAGAGGSVPQAIFSKMLIEKMPGMSRVYYCNSGSEANEKVIKMVRQISQKHHNGQKWKILYRERDYHGTTLGTLATSGQFERAAHYGPYPEGFVMVCKRPSLVAFFNTLFCRYRTALSTESSGTSRSTASAPLMPSSKSSCERARTPLAAWS